MVTQIKSPTRFGKYFLWGQEEKKKMKCIGSLGVCIESMEGAHCRPINPTVR